MALKKFRPNTPGTRGLTLVDKKGLWNGKPVKSLTTGISKKEIKLAIENIFKVKVKKVNTSIVKGKLKSFRGSLGKRSDYKKAFVTLEDGQTIDINAGV